MKVGLAIGEFLERAAFVHPDRVAVVDDELAPGGGLGTLTYAELRRRAQGLAAGLAARGLEPGDRVAIVSPNSARFLTAFFGVSGYGRILVPINFRLNAEEVRYIVEHSGATMLLVDPEMDDALADVKAEQRIVLDGGDDDRALFGPLEDGETVPVWEPDEDATASINYTSGTTARPKGVQLTHRNLWLNATTFGWHLGVNESDVYLHTLPMFHCNGWGMPYGVTAMGGRHVVQRKVDGEVILQRIAREGVTLMCGAPTVVAMVLDAATARRERGEEVPGRDRVRIVVAGAPPPSKVIERVESELGWEFVQIYGLTETAPLLTINRAGSEDRASDDVAARATRLSRAGVPAVGVQIRVDEQGEICARSNNVFAGYWEQPEETAKAIPDGWFHTGDGGAMDGPYVVIADRKKDVIISGGENVSSIEVEDCLYQHPAVAEACVIGVPDERWGETVKALVVVRDGQTATEQELIDFCRSKLAHYKCPTSIELRDALERTATGKLQKFRMRAPYWEGREKLVN